MQQLTSDLEECSSAYVRTLTELSKSQSLSSRQSSPSRSPVDASGEIGSIEHASQQDRLLQRSMNAREEIESIHEESKKNMEVSKPPQTLSLVIMLTVTPDVAEGAC